ncbi:stalk domain-containing protein [Acetivibrio mesophilus]|uniref:Copper amine oxidase N-terminal domain-containing protein n=1 Tax=Acetivibrio mesophilus TaxID=2487273 RepID=A0A4Q0I811_9FIRM|nr:copper amine oxidase N-terminal domain-containing protein [Acetivibrio mesophilus]ODM24968.1 copper amine oxidase [Clostridium sp. Bc-iso-3]RXE60035.1 copper amine oxidase N-terminal domain-containing protein [Acetivibrio mesophilus]HHV30038.1 copper amine oxidase N-terminal domain-containing protein [Clostridium sp.]
MKKIGVFFSCLMIFCTLIVFNFTGEFSFAAQDNSLAASDIKVFLNGLELKFDVAPYIKNGRTMVPFRAIFEALGVDISWNGENRTIMATNDTTQIYIEIGKAFAYVNGYKVNLDAEAEILGGRTFVPLRFVSENTGADVSWDGSRRAVHISYVDQVRDLGEISYFRELEFTVDRWESKADGKILTVHGRVNLDDKMLMLEMYDSSRRYSSAIAQITGKDGGMNIYEADIYLTSSFNPKTILVKTLSDSNKPIKISQYDL